MTIESLYTIEFTVKRQVWVAKKSSFVEQGTFLGHIQQGTEDAMQQHLGFSFTKAHTIWCAPGTDIKEGDRIEGDSKEYDVRFVTDRNIGSDGHLEIIVERND